MAKGYRRPVLTDASYWDRFVADRGPLVMSVKADMFRDGFGTATPVPSKRPAPGAKPARPPVGGPISVRVLIPTPNPDNASGWTWQKRAKLAKQHRDAVGLVLLGQAPPPPPWTVTLTRVVAGTLADDGLRAAMKWVRDSCAVHLLGGRPGEMDDSPLIAWEYRQARGKRNEPAVDIDIITRKEP